MANWKLEIPERWQRGLAVLVALALAVFILDRSAAVMIPFLQKALGIMTPVLVAFAIAYLLDPLVDRIEERGRSRGTGVALVLAAFVLCTVFALLVIVPTVVDQVQNLGAKVATLADRGVERLKDAETLERVLGPEYELRIAEIADRAKQTLTGIDWQAAVKPLGNWLKKAVSGGYQFVAGMLSLVLIPVLTVYLLKDIDRIRDSIVELVPPRSRDRLLGPLRDVDDALSRFVRGQLMVAACLAALYSTGLVATQTPLGLTLGLFAGAVSFIPYLGLILGLVPALLLNFIEHGSWPLLIGVVATFAIAQFLEGNFITPKIVGESVGLHPVVVIIAVIAGGSFFGLAGMLLALPAVAAGMVYVRRWNARYKESAFYQGGGGGSDEPAPEAG